MNISQFNKSKLLSYTEILDRIGTTKKELIFLYFQNQMDSNSNFKNHKIKLTKRYLRQLNTLLVSKKIVKI